MSIANGLNVFIYEHYKAIMCEVTLRASTTFVLTRETTTTENMHIIELWMGFHNKNIIHRIFHGLRVQRKMAIAMHENAYRGWRRNVPTAFLRKTTLKTSSLSTEGE